MVVTRSMKLIATFSQITNTKQSSLNELIIGPMVEFFKSYSFKLFIQVAIPFLKITSDERD